MTELSNLTPLQVNDSTGEVYLQLPAPHENIRITPPRHSDAERITSLLNDPRVYEYLASPPFPYKQEHAVHWLKKTIATSESIMKELREGRQFVDGCPVRSIREVQEDGSDIFLGDIGIDREESDVPWVRGLAPSNEFKQNGDPTILWSVGDYLSPSHHRRGIMSAALKTIIYTWAVPRMNCRRILATAFEGNIASIGVFLKCGFELDLDVVDAVSLPEGRGGHKKTLHVIKWDYPVEII